uniref:leucine-rich repeat-containing protein 71 isoform X2 n=1 Tax=Doryrhamphus excisus TaxID=161450 RepID=UPI0025AEA904|nr:leucine-rich repeat-containing protein 71 isoform X2 [Doryrhamphus excisus]
MARKKQAKEKSEKTAPEVEEPAPVQTGAPSNETSATRTFDDYECSGNVMTDFPGLCALVEMKDVPTLKTKSATNAEFKEVVTGGRQAHKKAVSDALKPALQVELENGDPFSPKSMKVFGWKVEEQVIRVLSKMISSIHTLHSLDFWQAGLTDPMVVTLSEAISLSLSLRVVTLEGNPLLEHSHHHLLSEGSVLTHLYLRNNQIGDEGARLLGLALSTNRYANWSLVSLNLSFNHIGDAGAVYIAKGLRFNRTLLFLSLSNNQIGDSGATELAMVLGEIVLTHEETVERRKMLLEKTYCVKLRSRFMNKIFRQAKLQPQWLTEEDKLASMSSSPADVDPSSVAKLPADHLPSAASAASLSSGKGESKSTAKKRESSKPEGKRAPGKDQKCSKKDGQDNDERGQVTDQEQKKPIEMPNLLVSDSLEHRNGDLILPGNTSLASLNLAGNRITELSLPQFLSSLQMQDGGKGLLRLCLQGSDWVSPGAKSSGVTHTMKTQKTKGATTSPSRRRKPRFTLCGRKKKNSVIRGKLRLRSIAGAFLILGVIVVLVGVALAVAGYRMSRFSILGSAEGNNVSETSRNWSLGAKSFLSTVSLIHSERMKLLGPVIMGVGLFILICANTVLYENRDRETQMLLAQMRSVICSVSAAVPSADLQEIAAANSMAKHQWVSSLPAAQLNSFCRQQLVRSEPLLQTRPGSTKKDTAEGIYQQPVLHTEAVHHQESVPPPSTDSSSCNSTQFETDLSKTQPVPFAKLNNCLMSASSMSTLGLDDVDTPTAQPRRCQSMSYRTKPYTTGTVLSMEKNINRERGRTTQPAVMTPDPHSRVCINIPGQVMDVTEEQTRQSWPRLDLGIGRRYLKLENKEDSVDKLLDQLEQQCSQWDRSFGSGPFQ